MKGYKQRNLQLTRSHWEHCPKLGHGDYRAMKRGCPKCRGVK